MKTVKLSDLKVGQELANAAPTKYGQGVNRKVVSLKSSKTGRIKMQLSYDYRLPDGTFSKLNVVNDYSHLPIEPSSLVSVK